MMKKNLGAADRILRGIFGVLALYLGIVIVTNSLLKVLFMIFGLFGVVESIIGYCHLYTWAGINTNKKQAKKIKKEVCGKLNAKALATSMAILLGGYVFFLGLFLTFFPNTRFIWVSPELLSMLATFYPGYSATIIGSFIGLFWGALCGAVCGTVIAWLHNFTLERGCE